MLNTVLTIGNFDGVHAGHRMLLRRVVELGREHNLQPAVLTFDPHPTRVVRPDRAPRLLTTVEERVTLIREQGVEHVVVLPFTPETARLSPEEFVERIVAGELHARIVMVGDNFRFGHKQAGDIKTLSELGVRFGFQTHVVDAVHRRGRIVSSSEIRRLIEEGSVAMAGRLLERCYTLSGDVVSGHGIGSKQTVPTLNLSTPAEVIPANGVYITRTRDLETEDRWNSITNVGTRPTFDGDSLTIETFLLSSFDGLTPGRISVEFLRRVRAERKFENADALKQQIFLDVGRAQTFFRRLPGGLH
ncbi:MAG TPA: bifunctional riboflavin kinase/FAD synthetase [Bryobacteraceae bacterium]|jgi:riboflavin kinase/FMN adenylyltransferase|nr:bifunctional riboflavin kinase/FAD synthetase [Bryobacteraceae bacterium]